MRRKYIAIIFGLILIISVVCAYWHIRKVNEKEEEKRENAYWNVWVNSVSIPSQKTANIFLFRDNPCRIFKDVSINESVMKAIYELRYLLGGKTPYYGNPIPPCGGSFYKTSCYVVSWVNNDILYEDEKGNHYFYLLVIYGEGETDSKSSGLEKNIMNGKYVIYKYIEGRDFGKSECQPNFEEIIISYPKNSNSIEWNITMNQVNSETYDQDGKSPRVKMTFGNGSCMTFISTINKRMNKCLELESGITTIYVHINKPKETILQVSGFSDKSWSEISRVSNRDYYDSRRSIDIPFWIIFLIIASIWISLFYYLERRYNGK